MAGKKVWIHSKDDSDPPETGFVQLWSPIIVAVGAKVLRDDDVPQNKVDLAQWIVSGKRLGLHCQHATPGFLPPVPVQTRRHHSHGPVVRVANRRGYGSRRKRCGGRQYVGHRGTLSTINIKYRLVVIVLGSDHRGTAGRHERSLPPLRLALHGTLDTVR